MEFINDNLGTLILSGIFSVFFGIILYFLTRGFADMRREIAESRREAKADIAEARKETKADIADFRQEARDDIVRVEGKVDNVMVELATTNERLANATAEIAETKDKVNKLNNIVVANDTVIAMFKDHTTANTN